MNRKGSKRSKTSKGSKISKRSKTSKGSKSCKLGMIKRSGYVKKNGTVVKSNCIISRSDSGKKTTDEVKKYLKSKDSIHRAASKKFPLEASQKCSKGEILRNGYKASRNETEYWVAPACIKSVVGRSVKGPKLITIMDKDVLGKFGYSDLKNISKLERHKSLKKAIKKIKPLSVFRRIVAIATLNKNKDLKLYDVLREDAEWLKNQKEYIDNLA